jgi:hypothetical protein
VGIAMGLPRLTARGRSGCGPATAIGGPSHEIGDDVDPAGEGWLARAAAIIPDLPWISSAWTPVITKPNTKVGPPAQMRRMESPFFPESQSNQVLGNNFDRQTGVSPGIQCHGLRSQGQLPDSAVISRIFQPAKVKVPSGLAGFFWR